jgi:hypothetical protein
MPYLYCARHGSEREADIAARRTVYRQEGETVLVVAGTLTSGPWMCDRCGDELDKGDQAWLVSSFSRSMHERLCDYDFGYELEYFAMTKRDQATSYGAAWPDDSITHRRVAGRRKPRPREEPICALDLLPKG